jgi:hypothetical protein
MDLLPRLRRSQPCFGRATALIALDRAANNHIASRAAPPTVREEPDASGFTLTKLPHEIDHLAQRLRHRPCGAHRIALDSLTEEAGFEFSALVAKGRGALAVGNRHNGDDSKPLPTSYGGPRVRIPAPSSGELGTNSVIG